jgi:hypothetical protein
MRNAYAEYVCGVRMRSVYAEYVCGVRMRSAYLEPVPGARTWSPYVNRLRDIAPKVDSSTVILQQVTRYDAKS